MTFFSVFLLSSYVLLTMFYILLQFKQLGLSILLFLLPLVLSNLQKCKILLDLILEDNSLQNNLAF